MFDRLLDHKADEHFFEEVHAPIFDLCIELLRRNIEKVSQLLGVVEPEKVRKSSRHEHLERDEMALAKLVMKEGEKPGKFLLPHGIILLEFGPYRIFMEGNPEGIQNQRPLGIMELSGLFVSQLRFQSLRDLERILAHGFHVQAEIKRQKVLERIETQPIGHQRGPLRFHIQKFWGHRLGQQS